ncbi:hypothetical protein [Ponticaulis sp.]|uniref:hypothetical protein n=1 Tax=Ponticaulis sp. TaxID=2020902 RepID=UPI000B6D08BC|nr:hypothetical protein [Ponticaulis sp.]MAI90991.1 hypothetical protein [Ponticaulis sp.]OUX98332.1 MAG: hypothetical protein CBB65_11140 [Hyphomonadaceae bacterium TMED5]|tara:strand:+ start:148599 stop:148910 length:312 start_codon:yes stop_codon:yes gene_type:complete
MLLLRFGLVLLAFALAAMCIWASGAGHFANEFGMISAYVWGKVSLVDLYLGFLLIGLVIAAFEPLKYSAPLILALIILGNIIGALWLAWRLPDIWIRLRRPAR